MWPRNGVECWIYVKGRNAGIGLAAEIVIALTLTDTAGARTILGLNDSFRMALGSTVSSCPRHHHFALHSFESDENNVLSLSLDSHYCCVYERRDVSCS